MGLAPWARAWDKPAPAALDAPTLNPQEPASPISARTKEVEMASKAVSHDIELLPPSLTTGQLDGSGENALRLRWDVICSLADPGGWKRLPPYKESDWQGPLSDHQRSRLMHARLAARVQIDLEAQILSFLGRLKERTGATNLGFGGGVALNSVVNGRISRELGFANFFVPPWPGDEGIALGCAAFALHAVTIEARGRSDEVRELDGAAERGASSRSAAVATGPVRFPLESCTRAPYLGGDLSVSEVEAAIDELSPWLEVVQPSSLLGEEQVGVGSNKGSGSAGSATDCAPSERVVHALVAAIVAGEIVAVCRGRSEVGPRALGHRSILADPRRADMHARANHIKQRELFRPLAPAVLAEKAADWFEGVDKTSSPFMSITAFVHLDKAAEVPAVTHVDGSARLQTVDSTR